MRKLADLNELGRDEFTRIVGPVFEHSPWIAARAWERRPFSTTEKLHAELTRAVTDASAEEKLALVRAHPDLATRAELTPASQNEQAAAGLNGVTEAERAKFRDRNDAYRERFGFPFVICARLSDKAAMLEALAARLKNSPEAELETALREISKIASLRLADLLDE